MGWLSDQFSQQAPNYEMSNYDLAEWAQQQNWLGTLRGQMDGGSPYQANSESAMNNALQGNAYQGPQGMNQGQVEDYYRTTLHDPAMRQYENETRPAWMSKVGNLHSGHRMNQERRGYEDLYSGLNQQRGNLMWQNTLRNQNLEQHAADMNMQGQMGALGMMPQLDPQMRAEAMYQQQMMGQSPTVTPYGGGSNWQNSWGGGMNAIMQGQNMMGLSPDQFIELVGNVASMGGGMA